MSASPSIYIVTGSTDGIGKHTATNLASRGAHAKVFIHGRNPARVTKTVEELRQRNANGIDSVVGDLGSFSDIRRVAAELHTKIEALPGDAPITLINNAGVFEQKRKASVEGLEMTFAINVAAPFLLTGLLLPLLQKRKNSRIVNISSISQGGSVPWEDLQLALPGAYSDHRSYSLSKLLMAMLSMEQSDRFGSTDLPIVCCDPGTVNTKMLEAGWGMYGMDVSAANDETFLATDEKVGEMNGSYFVSKTARRANSEAYDKEARKKLWKYLEEKTGFSY
jgi:NAD(P)-dependent dehydrogenase (short-subunit alcohol dehydrogenase family)